MATTPDDDAPEGDRPMTLGEHLDELRKRLFWCVVIGTGFVIGCAYIEEVLVGIALWPAYSVMRDVRGGEFIATEVGEQFMTGLKVDIVFGLFLASPLILYILWGFVARGLHPRERRFVRIYAPLSYVLFLGGCAFFYFKIQPIMLRALLTWHSSDIPGLDGTLVNVAPKLTMRNTISFFLSMTLVMGLIFELPLVMLFLQAIRVCTWRTFVRAWRHFMFGLFVFSAVVTPTGDAITLLLFMAPVVVLFFGGILLCRMMAPKDTEEPHS
jgi:sec-independent protein translocase protein TatC